MSHDGSPEQSPAMSYNLQYLELVGQRFGRWTVTDYPRYHTPTASSEDIVVRCDCGTVAHVNVNSLLSDASQSCGCLRRDRARAVHYAKQDARIGQRFGRLTVLAVSTRHPLRYLCRCECGNVKPLYYNGLRSGVTKGCGCLRHGHRHTPITGVIPADD